MTIHICMLHGIGTLSYPQKGQCHSWHRQTCLPWTKVHHCWFSFFLSPAPLMDSQKLFLRSWFVLIFAFFKKSWFSKVTTNISSSNFVGFTKKSLKAESILDCASRCVYWEQRSSYCNAFRLIKSNFKLWNCQFLLANFWHCLAWLTIVSGNGKTMFTSIPLQF